MQSKTAALMREIGNYDSKQSVSADRLTDEKWKTTAAELFKPFAAQLSASALRGIKELVVVPDGFLWYLPFEMLQVESNGARKSLVEVVRVRYAPTVGLAIADARPANGPGPRVVVHGRLFSSDSDAVLNESVGKLRIRIRPPSYCERRFLRQRSS